MIPVDQEYLHDPEHGVVGDCFRACIASLLGFPISQVPHFVKDSGSDWKYSLSQYLSKFGLGYLEARLEDPAFFKEFLGVGDGIDVYHTIVGPSPRFPGQFHCVVGKNGEMVHDPHTTREGLAGDPKEWSYGFLIQMDGRKGSLY